MAVSFGHVLLAGVAKCTFFLVLYVTTLFAHLKEEGEKTLTLFGCEVCSLGYIGHEVGPEVLRTERGAWSSFVVVMGYTILIVLYFDLTDVVGL